MTTVQGNLFACSAHELTLLSVQLSMLQKGCQQCRHGNKVSDSVLPQGGQKRSHVARGRGRQHQRGNAPQQRPEDLPDGVHKGGSRVEADDVTCYKRICALHPAAAIQYPCRHMWCVKPLVCWLWTMLLFHVLRVSIFYNLSHLSHCSGVNRVATPVLSRH